MCPKKQNAWGIIPRRLQVVLRDITMALWRDFAFLTPIKIPLTS